MFSLEILLMAKINIQFTRFSAFYSPLIMTMSGGFLAEEGLEASCSIAKPGESAIDALLDGSAHVVQSALSQGLITLEKGKSPATLHFAQINEMDGFFLTGRDEDPNFNWSKLIGKNVLIDHGNQPLSMFKYACHKAGINYGDINAINVGTDGQMDVAFRDGEGSYIHQQGPAPQQLEFDGVGYVVASVGKPIGTCGFSSIAAIPEWLESDMAKTFMRAYQKSRFFINEAPASEIAAAEKSFFPDIEQTVLENAIDSYQRLGCWSPHVEITKKAYDATLDVFQYVNQITKRHAYENCCAPPPSE